MFLTTIEKPWYLLLLLVLPWIWIWGRQSLSGLGRWRRAFALVLRSVVIVLIVLALAEAQWQRKNERMTVTYLLDQSESIPPDQREAMAEYVVSDVEKFRDAAASDRASVIVFGRQAHIEVPPLDDDLPLVHRLEAVGALKRDATNLESALRLAQATFPEDSSRRVVIVSDGNENLGNALRIARSMAADGVGMDVVPIWINRDKDVSVERMALPSGIRIDQPFDARVVVENLSTGEAPDTAPPPTDSKGRDSDDVMPGAIAGRLRVVRRQGKDQVVLLESPVLLPPGKSVFSFHDKLKSSDFYEYSAQFIADNPQQNLVAQNDIARSFTHVQGTGKVLLIEDFSHRKADGSGEFSLLADRLRGLGLEVVVQFSNELFTSLAELQPYDTVILANVPRSGGSTSEVQSFSDAQIKMLVQNTQQMGSGLIMLGGPESMGPGGWGNTELEKAMPVNFHVKNAKVKATGALAMVMHASEIPEGNHWQKVIGIEALKSLGPHDYAAVVQWDGRQGRESWLWGGRNGFLTVGGNSLTMRRRLDQMTPGDMPDFEPSLRMARAAFASLPNVGVKHMICISDGDPTSPTQSTLQGLKQLGVKVTTVAVGAHGPPGHATMQHVAKVTGGRYYVVRSPNALPKIYQKEARVVSRPLIVEKDLQPTLVSNHEILKGIDALPPLRGFVMTTTKENPLVEVSVLSPFPEVRENATLLAGWSFGLGRSVVFTSDAGYRWATEWADWPGYDKFFGQLVRWSMRPVGETGNFSIATERLDGTTRVVVDALDKDEEFLNFLNLSVSVVDPSMTAQQFNMRQVAPGRYQADVPTGSAGNYFFHVMPAPGLSPLRTGVNIPYSAEFRDRQTNRQLLKQLADIQPAGGKRGLMRGGNEPAPMDQQFQDDTFRRDLADAVSSNFIWPWLLLVAGCLFFGDVFVRRVAMDFAWIGEKIRHWASRWRRHDEPVEWEEPMERLRSRKAAVRTELDERRAATRFQVDDDEEVDTSVLEQENSSAEVRDRPRRPAASVEVDAEEDHSYTARLKRAKQDAMRNREGKGPKGR